MKKVKNLLENFDGELYDVCFKLLEENENNFIKVFQFVCENYSNPPESKSIPIKRYFDDGEFRQIELICGNTINAIISSAVLKCHYGQLEKSNFYSYLWNTYCLNFTSRKEKAFAFYYTIIDRQIPIRFIAKPLRLSNDSFNEVMDKNRYSIEKIKYLFDIRLGSKTEVSSLVLSCLDEIEDYESKVVVLASALTIYSKINANYKELDYIITKKIKHEFNGFLEQLKSVKGEGE